jgi:serine/threonine protein kinase
MEYAPPEILMRSPYNYKLDIWSLGVMLFVMVFGVFPFGEHTSPDH